MPIVKGRSFNESFANDQMACILNESAIREFNITDIEKTRLYQPIGPGKYNTLQLIGVVKNFNFESLRNPIKPYIFCFKTDGMTYGFLSVKLTAANYTKTINEIENRWKEFTSNTPLQHYFVDQDFEKIYIQERQNARMAVIFSVLAIFIAALGLFGLTSFTVEQKTKEIGVRKAMGSTIAGIYLVISKDVVILVTISALVAWPLIYYLAGKWLENFYYRISLSIVTFIAGLSIALGIAVLTISYRILKAASINPAQSLKYE
jgi:putative ABC transport system permease protein